MHRRAQRIIFIVSLLSPAEISGLAVSEFTTSCISFVLDVAMIVVVSCTLTHSSENTVMAKLGIGKALKELHAAGEENDCHGKQLTMP